MIQDSSHKSQSDIHFQSNLYQSSNPTRRWMHSTRRNWVMSALDKYSCRFLSALEVGTGCGIYTKRLAALSDDVTSIDINSDFVIAASIDNPTVTTLVSSVETFSSTKPYDLILISEVLEHVSNTKIALHNLYQLLSEDGFLILTTPNKFSLPELVARLLKFPAVARLARSIYGEPVDELGHINLRTRTELLQELEEHGFVVVETTDIGFYIPVIAEWGGEIGRSIIMRAESMLGRSKLGRNLLWTQCYVLRKN